MRKPIFNFEITALGSLPVKDPKKACESVFNNFEFMPFWPQLPKRSYLENMYVQYMEGLPAVQIDEEKKTVFIDASKDISNDAEIVYGHYLEGDTEFFRMSEARAPGFYEFLKALKARVPNPITPRWLKGHITGPVSLGLTVTDEKKRAVFYNTEFFELVNKVLAMKARWQVKKLKEIIPNVVIFIDEPYLVSIGSSYVNINIEDAMKRIDELIDAIRLEGALVGLHCCGNTDWPLILKRDLDIVNFDAYSLAKEFLLYTEEIKSFIEKGGAIAWGIVPSSEAALKESADSLKARLSRALDALAKRGVDVSKISSLITPSCGLGSLDEKTADKIISLLKELSEKLKN